jgi:hypothetical protein
MIGSYGRCGPSEQIPSATAPVHLDSDVRRQARLPDPGLATHDGHRRSARSGLPAGEQAPQLDVPADALPARCDGAEERRKPATEELPLLRSGHTIGEIDPVAGPQLPQQGRHVTLDRSLRHAEERGDLHVRHALCDGFEYLGLAAADRTTVEVLPGQPVHASSVADTAPPVSVRARSLRAGTAR